MTEQETLAPEATEASNQQTQTQAAESAVKTYTQDEVDNMMARMRGSIEHKLSKKYEDLGDPKELRQLKADAEKRQQEQQIKRGEFEKTLQDLAAKKDAEISKRDSIIKEYKVNSPLLTAAAKYKSVNPEQVKSLLINSVRLNETGDIEVLDNDGNVRYDDKGNAWGVDNLVKSFLDENPHFQNATASTTNSQSSVTPGKTTPRDLASLDMNNSADRQIYKKMKAEGRV